MILLAVVVFLILLALFSLTAPDGKTSSSGQEGPATNEKKPLRAGGHKDVERLQEMVHASAMESISQNFNFSNDPLEMRRILSAHLLKTIIEEEEKTEFALSDKQREELCQDILDEMLGFGPIQRFLDDPGVSEVKVSGHAQINVIRNGQPEATSAKFRNTSHLMQIIERMTAPQGLQLNRQNPSVSLRLPDGSAATVVLSPPPDSLPVLNITK